MSHIDMEKVRDPWCWYQVDNRGKKYRAVVTSLYRDGRADLVVLDGGLSGGSWELTEVEHGTEAGRWRFCNPDPAIQKLVNVVAEAVPDDKPAPQPDSEPEKAPQKVEDDGFFESEPAPAASRKTAARATRQ